ncbi:hypothetical protein AVEN_174348-1 [Araneus ventricosus]|uniref:Uncharacterized protein n=1 Tax=Araneus ventricosus TaxID=182803 RepID=A0A4Y2JFB0_ARAVE|nr:hypothetical protein AVEN_174348-1 [Araneus ventricosus]
MVYDKNETFEWKSFLDCLLTLKTLTLSAWMDLVILNRVRMATSSSTSKPKSKRRQNWDLIPWISGYETKDLSQDHWTNRAQRSRLDTSS